MSFGRSRREFVKSMVGAATLSSMPNLSLATGSSPGPLGIPKFRSAPLGSILPLGWLKLQLEIQARGLTGHLDEFWPDLGTNSGWLGGTGESWERGPYYLDGLVPLAFLLQDPRLIEKANRWIEWTIANQQSNGQFGPRGNDDWWPRMVMLKALAQYHEATRDDRVIQLMERYFAYQLKELSWRPLREWGRYRWQDEVLSIAWLQDRVGERRWLPLASLLQKQGYDWATQFKKFRYTQKMDRASLGFSATDALPDRAMQTHGVNNAMALKSGPVWSLFSGNPADGLGLKIQLNALDQFHGLPNGMFSGDEHLAGRNPSQGIELCAVVEEMFSLEQSSAILGQAWIGDRLEKIAFNALPAALTDDIWAHQYDQQPNQISCSLRQRPWTSNGPESNLFGLEPNFGCCCANLHQGWPKFASSLWMRDLEGGAVAGVYAPSEFHFNAGAGTSVVLVEETDYPFSENIVITVRTQRPVQFPLSFRIPEWASNDSIQINGESTPAAISRGYATVLREWKSGDRIEIRFPMQIRARPGYLNSLSVERGPLVFSLNIKERWVKLRQRGLTADWQVLTDSPWNFAIEKESLRLTTSASSSAMPASGPFTKLGSPVSVGVRGRKLEAWKETDSVAGELPQSPVASTEPGEQLTLIPYGAAKLRITSFPELKRE